MSGNFYLYKFFDLPEALTKYVQAYNSFSKIISILKSLNISGENLLHTEGSSLFMPFKKISDLLVDNSIYFSHISQFNDSFECMCTADDKIMMRASAYIEEEITKSNYIKCVNNSIKKYGACLYSPFPSKELNYGIYSMCSNFSSTFMWSEYSKNSSGICIQFKINLENDKDYCSLKESGALTKYTFTAEAGAALDLYFSKVHYSNDLGKIVNSDTNKPAERLPDEFSKKILSSVFRKNTSYSQEGEVRFLLIGHSGLINLNSLKNRSGKNIFEPNAIIFGLHTNEKLKQFIKKNSSVPKYIDSEWDFIRNIIVGL